MIAIRSVKGALRFACAFCFRAGCIAQSQLPFKPVEAAPANAQEGQKMMVCQDTGIPIYWVDIGGKLRLDGSKLDAAIMRDTERESAIR